MGREARRLYYAVPRCPQSPLSFQIRNIFFDGIYCHSATSQSNRLKISKLPGGGSRVGGGSKWSKQPENDSKNCELQLPALKTIFRNPQDNLQFSLGKPSEVAVISFRSYRDFGSPANTCVRFTKTSKTPLMMSVAFGPTSCSSGLVPKSKLLQRPESHDGFVPKHCHHGGKNHALQAKRQD